MSVTTHWINFFSSLVYCFSCSFSSLFFLLHNTFFFSLYHSAALFPHIEKRSTTSVNLSFDFHSFICKKFFILLRKQNKSSFGLYQISVSCRTLLSYSLASNNPQKLSIGSVPLKDASPFIRFSTSASSVVSLES